MSASNLHGYSFRSTQNTRKFNGRYIGRKQEAVDLSNYELATDAWGFTFPFINGKNLLLYSSQTTYAKSMAVLPTITFNPFKNLPENSGQHFYAYFDGEKLRYFIKNKGWVPLTPKYTLSGSSIPANFTGTGQKLLPVALTYSCLPACQYETPTTSPLGSFYEWNGSWSESNKIYGTYSYLTREQGEFQACQSNSQTRVYDWLTFEPFDFYKIIFVDSTISEFSEATFESWISEGVNGYALIFITTSIAETEIYEIVKNFYNYNGSKPVAYVIGHATEGYGAYLAENYIEYTNSLTIDAESDYDNINQEFKDFVSETYLLNNNIINITGESVIDLANVNPLAIMANFGMGDNSSDYFYTVNETEAGFTINYTDPSAYVYTMEGYSNLTNRFFSSNGVKPYTPTFENMSFGLYSPISNVSGLYLAPYESGIIDVDVLTSNYYLLSSFKYDEIPDTIFRLLSLPNAWVKYIIGLAQVKKSSLNPIYTGDLT